MPISEGEWASIRALVDASVGKGGEYFVTGKVINRDESKKLVWLKEFGQQPIPLIAFDYDVRYYDTDQLGNITQKMAKVTVRVPKIGATVLVARELGVQRMPRCLGEIKGKNWILPGV